MPALCTPRPMRDGSRANDEFTGRGVPPNSQHWWSGLEIKPRSLLSTMVDILPRSSVLSSGVVIFYVRASSVIVGYTVVSKSTSIYGSALVKCPLFN